MRSAVSKSSGVSALSKTIPWRRSVIVRLDLKQAAHRQELDGLLELADVFLTAQRPAALERLGLGWDDLHARFPRLSHVSIVGRRSPEAGRPGHDLNYVGARGLLAPPELPRTLVADLGGAEAAVSAALAAVVNRERTGEGTHVEVSLTDAADRFAAPVRHGLTRPGGVLGGHPGGSTSTRIRAAPEALASLGAVTAAT